MTRNEPSAEDWSEYVALLESKSIDFDGYRDMMQCRYRLHDEDAASDGPGRATAVADADDRYRELTFDVGETLFRHRRRPDRWFARRLPIDPGQREAVAAGLAAAMVDVGADLDVVEMRLSRSFDLPTGAIKDILASIESSAGSEQLPQMD